MKEVLIWMLKLMGRRPLLTSLFLFGLLVIWVFSCPNEFVKDEGDGDPSYSLSRNNTGIRFYGDIKNEDFVIKNRLQLIQCGESITTAQRITYLEIQSDRLQKDVDLWMSNGNVTPDDLVVRLNLPLKKPGDARDPLEITRDFYFKYAPNWIPRNIATPDRMLSRWGNGFLYKGEKNGQFFWIGDFYNVASK